MKRGDGRKQHIVIAKRKKKVSREPFMNVAAAVKSSPLETDLLFLLAYVYNKQRTEKNLQESALPQIY